MSSTTTKSNQTRKLNRNKEIMKLAAESQGKQKFTVIFPTRKVFPGQQIRLFTNSSKNNFIGSQLAKNNPSEYLRQKQKLTVKQKKNENLRRMQTWATSQFNRSRGPGSRGRSATSITTANNITRRIREARTSREARNKRQREMINALLRGNFRE